MFVDLAVKQTASGSQVKYPPLTKTPGAAFSSRHTAEVLWAGQDRAEFTDTVQSASRAGTPDTMVTVWVEMFSFLVVVTEKLTARTQGTAFMLWLDGVLAVDHTQYLCLSNNTFLTGLCHAGFGRNKPFF